MQNKYYKSLFVFLYIINIALCLYIPEKEQLDQLIIKNIEIGNKKDNEIIINDENIKNITSYNIYNKRER